MPESITQYPPLPPDDLQRSLTIAQPDGNEMLPHIGIVGDTYTITVSGDQTNGRFCVIDMHIPPGGGPPPHRHDFEETFILLQGEMEVTFRGKKLIARPGIQSTFRQTLPTSSITLLRRMCVALHLFTGRPGQLFPAIRRAGCDPHYSTSRARQRATA
jgi:hypothetical protein